jgi:hypothetical protein
MIEDVELGITYRLDADVPVLCCGHVLRVGERFQVFSQPSKNRLIVVVVQGRYKHTLHKVRRSTFRMAATSQTVK